MDDELRARVLDNWGWAVHLARRQARKVRSLDQEEVAGEATVALIDAAQRFDPAAGVAFRSFAFHRISGAVRDYQRSQDLVGRHQRTAMNAGLETAWERRGELPVRLREDVSVIDRDKRKLPPQGGLTPEDRTLAAEVYRFIVDLPQPFARVLERHYLRGDRMRDIGASMGVTESRICQIAAEGVTMLRERIGAKG